MQKLRASASIKALPISETDSEVGKNLDLEREFLSYLVGASLHSSHVVTVQLWDSSAVFSELYSLWTRSSGLTYRQ